MPRISAAEKRENFDNALMRLREWLVKTPMIREKRVIYTLVTHVSSSGMTRDIRFFCIVENELLSLDWAVARALDWRLTDRGVRVSGCGMDMAFHTIDSVMAVLGDRRDWQHAYRLESL